MEAIVFKMFQVLFKFVGIMLLCGAMAGVLNDIQQKASHSKRSGLVNLLQVNQQLVGKTN